MIVTESDIKKMVSETVKKVMNEFNSLLCYTHTDYPEPDTEYCEGYIENYCCDLSHIVKENPNFYGIIRKYATTDDCDEVYVGRVDVSWERNVEFDGWGRDDYKYVDEGFSLSLSQDNPLAMVPGLSEIINKEINQQFDQYYDKDSIIEK